MNSKRIHSGSLTLFTLVTCCLTLSSAKADAQGTVLFSNHIPGFLVTHVYLGGDHQIAGNGLNDYPMGTQDWTGFTALLGDGYTAQLWFALGANQPESSLQPAFPTTTFYPGAAGAGFVVPPNGGMSLPGVPSDAPVTITMRVWDNHGGTITSWALAQRAGVASGESPLFTIPYSGDPVLPSPYLIGLTSFNIYQVPEPSVLALMGLGALAFCAFRHR